MRDEGGIESDWIENTTKKQLNKNIISNLHFNL